MNVRSLVFLIIALCPNFVVFGMKGKQVKSPRVRHTLPTEQTRFRPSIKPPSEKIQEQVTIFDYDAKRDFAEIKKIYNTMDEQTIKVLGRGIPEAIAAYPKGSRSDKYQMLDGTEVYSDIKVLRTAKNLVGFIISTVTQKSASHEITQCKIAPIVIAPEFRGKGYGTNLMQASIDYFAHEGCKTVLLDVHPENAGAIKLYTRMGFKEIGRDQDTVTMEWPVPGK